jgi:transposase
LKQIQAHIDYLEKEVAQLDQKLLEAMTPYQRQWELLQTLPGIDQMNAAALIAEIGVDMSLFGSAEKLASWAGMCPGNNESAGKKKAVRDATEMPLCDEFSVKRLTPLG